ncbi:hypothetical protein GCM10011383_43360 [Hymenobacter cavernae]|uniref:Outer membrane protein beta-barrel domain-containing protein n=1 Tax=Hymenobacter cavernae TaxID=2044852 RepID=A0ABQ1UU04_9BACT|nr:hypothetical protein GCM10011383_43360 [Hymenobacter cavernae]
MPVAAQGVKLGLKVGGSRSQVLGNRRQNLESAYQTKAQSIAGFYGGVNLSMPIRRSTHFAFQPELVYLQRGFSIENKPKRLRERDQYLELPLLVRFSQQGFFAEVGPQVGYFLANRTNETNFNGQDRAYSVEEHSEFKFSLGATAGLGYAWGSGPQVGVRYTVSSGRYTSSGVLAGYVGYTFGSSRSQKG